MTIRKVFLTGLFVAVCWTQPAQAEDSEVAELIARLRHSGATEFRYQETRHLELLSAPWKGWGYMLSSADGSLVKLQISPQRVIMAISGGQMLYFDPQQKQRQAISIGYAGESQRQIQIFRSMFQGHLDELKASYALAVVRQDSRRTLRLSPMPEKKEEGLPSVDISFDQQEQKRQILIKEVDGESTEYQLEKTLEGSSVELSIQRLLQEAAGD